MRDETGFALIFRFHLFGSDPGIVAGKAPRCNPNNSLLGEIFCVFWG